MWKNFEDTSVLSAGLNFCSVLGYHKTRSSLVTFKVAGISEGKESFVHQLIKLTCGTHDDEDEFS